MMLKHTVPQISTPDYILSVGSFDISVRQFILLTLGGLLSINVWMSFQDWLTVPWLNIGFWCLFALPLLLALAFGWISIRGHALEWWAIVLLRFWNRPRIYVWRSLEED